MRDSTVPLCHIDGNGKTDADEAAFASGAGVTAEDRGVDADHLASDVHKCSA